MRRPQLYLIDGSGFIFRAFHALPPLNRLDGTPVNAVMGFTNMLYKLLEDTIDAEYFAVIFDAGRRNFRHEIYPKYKAHRPELSPELTPQFEIVHEACRAFHVPAVAMEGYEADDLIATYAQQARQQNINVTIVSSDKDLMQLVDDHTTMLDPLKNILITPEQVMQKFGVNPEQVVDVQALAGDSSDGVPGVPGIGIKTAAELINTFGSLDNLLRNLDQIKQPKRRQVLMDNCEGARISYQLVSLKTDVPVTTTLEDFKRQPLDPGRITAFLTEQNFRTLLNRFAKKHDTVSVKAIHPTSAAAYSPSPSNPITLSVKERRYELVQTEAALARWIDRIIKAGVVAIDTETTSLIMAQAELVGISLSVDPYEACYIPLQHKRLPKNLFEETSQEIKQLSMATVLDPLRPLLSNPAILKVGHNIKYDMAVLQKYNVTLWPVTDTMVLSYGLDGTQHNHSLDHLATLHLSEQTTTYEQVTGSGRTQITFDYVDLDKACAYAAEDADITLRLFHHLRQRLAMEQATTIYETVDRPSIPVLLAMETAGISVDIAALKNLSSDFTDRLQQLEHQIHTLAGREFNIGSPKQLGEVLFDQLKLPGGKKTKTDAYGTGINVLEELVLKGYEIAEKLIDWRQLSKLKSTYADALVGQINPQTQRIHTSFRQTNTSTGRLSSSNPNLQNIPIRSEEGRKIRSAFVPASGHQFVSFDYSQIELRLLAHMADVDSLKQAFRQGLDIHKATAADVFHIPLEDVDHEYRRRAKSINFGIIYGMSAFGLAQQLKIDNHTAAHYIEQYSQRYPGIIEFMEKLKAQARQQGYVTTLLGRKCFVPGINDKNPRVRAAAERQAINAPLQGTAADIIKRAMIDVHRELADKSFHSKLLLQVHDELIFEVPDDEVQVLINCVKPLMENSMTLTVPLTVDVGVGANWDQAH